MPESGITKHNYLFCQFVNPARGHEGDRCDCFDTPSQRRTTLAKQRLARLRANREVNRASTSNDPESAVASDPAVTTSLTMKSRNSSPSTEPGTARTASYPSNERAATRLYCSPHTKFALRCVRFPITECP